MIGVIRSEEEEEEGGGRILSWGAGHQEQISVGS